MTTRRLVLMRHAKSDWPDGVPDRDRPLGARGRREAPEAGRWLGAAGVDPDLALVSPAARARETWELVASAAGYQVAPTYDERIYGAGARELLELIREVGPEVETLVVVAHNPGTEALAAMLDDGLGVARDRERLRAKFPTGAVAVLHTEIDTWADLDQEAARLVGYAVPRPSPRP